ncbi:MAG: hypothetical protein V2A62_03770 [Candidatus Woesearchaeota archaeon]
MLTQLYDFMFRLTEMVEKLRENSRYANLSYRFEGENGHHTFSVHSSSNPSSGKYFCAFYYPENEKTERSPFQVIRDDCSGSVATIDKVIEQLQRQFED